MYNKQKLSILDALYMLQFMLNCIIDIHERLSSKKHENIINMSFPITRDANILSLCML